MQRKHLNDESMCAISLEEMADFAGRSVFCGFLQFSKLISKIDSNPTYQSIEHDIGFLLVLLLSCLVTPMMRYWCFQVIRYREFN